jgi:TRAP-type C4-dicarboxylate transport system substrate-binding protein
MKTITSIKKCTGLFAAVAIAGAFATSAIAQTAPLVMKMGTATINDAQHEWMKVYAGALEKASKGRIKPEVYPASQLGPIPSQVQGVQFGSIQVWVGPPEFLAGLDSRFELLSVPGVFKDVQHVSRTFQDKEFSTAFLALGANKNLKGLGMWLSGPMVVNTRTPVKTLADLEGKKIRVLASAMQTEPMKKLNAAPVPMTLGEVMPALQQGAIDGNLTSTPVLQAMRFYSVAKYMYETHHQMVTSMAFVNKPWFDKLPPDLQKAVTDTAIKTSVDVNKWAIDFVASQRAAWIKSGGEIVEMAPADRAQLAKLMAPIAAEVTAKKPEQKQMFELLMKAAKRTQ